MSALVPRKAEFNTLMTQRESSLLSLFQNSKSKLVQFQETLAEMTINGNLNECTIDSVITSAVRIVQLGLNINPLLGEAYIVPYNVKVKEKNIERWEKRAQLQIGVKGYQILGFRTGWTFKTQAVYKCDQFNADLSKFDENFTLIPNYEKRNEEDGKWVFNNLIGVIVHAKDPRGNIHSKYIRRTKLEKIRLLSPNQKKSPDMLTDIWFQWAEEMYSKTALKYGIKRLPIDSSVMAAIIADEEGERGELELIDVEVAPSVAPNESPALMKGRDIAASLQNMGLSLYFFEGKAVVEGNTFNSASVLKDLGFKHEDGEWCFDFDSEVDLIEACLPGIEVEQKGEYLGVYDNKVGQHQDKLIELGFAHAKQKAVWLKKIA